jgi:hypothetical protein
MAPKQRPGKQFAGTHAPTTKATRLPGTGKKKRRGGGAAAGGDDESGGGGGKRTKDKSFLGLLASGAGFAGAWVARQHAGMCERALGSTRGDAGPSLKSHLPPPLPAALWAWTVWARGQQGQRDRQVLDGMLARPLALTQHAECRMECRCGAGEGAGVQWHPSTVPAADHRMQTMLSSPRATPTLTCRYIGRGEIEETLRKGRINARKSQPALHPCPKYAVDATVGPQLKHVQASVGAGVGRGVGAEAVLASCSAMRGHRSPGATLIMPDPHLVHRLPQGVFAACPRETRVLTVIDTDTDWVCGPC